MRRKEEEEPRCLAARPRQRRCPVLLSPSNASTGLVTSCQRLEYEEEEEEEEEEAEEEAWVPVQLLFMTSFDSLFL